MNEIFIILLNYNNYRDTIECVNSIIENEKQIKYKIVVVDNSSTNDSVKKLQQIENIHLIVSNENNGFANGNNIGIKYALEQGAEYILLLNNDTIITQNAISKMYKKIEEHQEIGIMGARIMYYDEPNKINCIGGKIDWTKAIAVIENKDENYEEKQEDFKYTEFMTGCCMLIKKEVIERAGYLPEEYFMYYEDVDYCVQVLDSGFKLGICLDSIIYHKESASSGGKASPFAIKWNTRNRLIFIKKYLPKKIVTKLWFYLTRFIVGIKYIVKGQKEELCALIDGIREGRKYCKRSIR